MLPFYVVFFPWPLDIISLYMKIIKNVSWNTFPNMPLNLFNNIVSQLWFMMMKEDLTSCSFDDKSLLAFDNSRMWLTVINSF